MVNKRVLVTVVVAVIFALGFTSAHASTVTFLTPSGATESSGLPVDAQAVFTTGASTLTLTLTNLEANPTSVAQNLSDLSFTVSGVTGGFSNYLSSAQLVSVAANGTPTLDGTVSTGWTLTQSANINFLLNDLGAGAAGPANTIIGPPGSGGIYSNANASIAGNTEHNPFINQAATFSFSAAGITSGSTVSNVVFSFGTTSGNNVGSAVPIPPAIWLLGSGLLGLVGVRRRFTKRGV